MNNKEENKNQKNNNTSKIVIIAVIITAVLLFGYVKSIELLASMPAEGDSDFKVTLENPVIPPQTTMIFSKEIRERSMNGATITLGKKFTGRYNVDVTYNGETEHYAIMPKHTRRIVCLNNYVVLEELEDHKISITFE